MEPSPTAHFIKPSSLVLTMFVYKNIFNALQGQQYNSQLQPFTQTELMKHFNGIDNCRFHLSPSCQTIAWVSTRRKPKDEHIFFISLSDRQIKAKCQEKLNEATINRLLQGIHARKHTHTGTDNNVRLLGADAHTAFTHRCTLKDIKCKCMFFFFLFVLTTQSGRC